MERAAVFRGTGCSGPLAIPGGKAYNGGIKIFMRC